MQNKKLEAIKRIQRMVVDKEFVLSSRQAISYEQLKGCGT